MPTPTWPTVGVIGKLAEALLAAPSAPTGLVRPGDRLLDEASAYLVDENGDKLTG